MFRSCVMKVTSMWCCAGSVRTLIHDDRTTVNRAATPGLQSAAAECSPWSRAQWSLSTRVFLVSGASRHNNSTTISTTRDKWETWNWPPELITSDQHWLWQRLWMRETCDTINQPLQWVLNQLSEQPVWWYDEGAVAFKWSGPIITITVEKCLLNKQELLWLRSYNYCSNDQPCSSCCSRCSSSPPGKYFSTFLLQIFF